MNDIENKISNKGVFLSLLCLSFIPLIVRSFDYVSIGGYAPLMLILVMGMPILFGILYNQVWVVKMIKLWSFMMLSFGIVRLAIEVMFYFSSLQEVHIREQFTIGFNLINVAYILGGIYIIKTSKRVIRTLLIQRSGKGDSH